MHVAGLEAKPVHGRQMADRIARMAVDDELRARRRARGEIEQHRVVGPRRTVGLEACVRTHERGERPPAFGRNADRDADHLLLNPGELLGVGPVRDQELRLAALEPVGDVGGRELRHRRDQHEAELHRRQHRHPQLRRRAEHHQEPVAALRPDRRAGRWRGWRSCGRVRRSCGSRPCCRRSTFSAVFATPSSGREFGVEPVERPVEALRPRPDELGLRGGIAVVEREQEIARLAEGRRVGARRQGRGKGGHGGLGGKRD